jgi:hypothetical protein
VDGTPPSKVGEKVGKTSGRIPRKTTQKIIEILREHPALGRRELATLLGGITKME